MNNLFFLSRSGAFITEQQHEIFRLRAMLEDKDAKIASLSHNRIIAVEQEVFNNFF